MWERRTSAVWAVRERTLQTGIRCQPRWLVYRAPGDYHGENGYGWIKGQRERAVPDLEAYHRTHTFLSDALTIEAGKEIAKAVQAGQPFYLNMAHYAVACTF